MAAKRGFPSPVTAEAGFEVLVISDQSIRYQQNLKNYTIAAGVPVRYRRTNPVVST